MNALMHWPTRALTKPWVVETAKAFDGLHQQPTDAIAQVLSLSPTTGPVPLKRSSAK